MFNPHGTQIFPRAALIAVSGQKLHESEKNKGDDCNQVQSSRLRFWMPYNTALILKLPKIKSQKGRCGRQGPSLLQGFSLSTYRYRYGGHICQAPCIMHGQTSHAASFTVSSKHPTMRVILESQMTHYALSTINNTDNMQIPQNKTETGKNANTSHATLVHV